MCLTVYLLIIRASQTKYDCHAFKQINNYTNKQRGGIFMRLPYGTLLFVFQPANNGISILVPSN